MSTPNQWSNGPPPPGTPGEGDWIESKRTPAKRTGTKSTKKTTKGPTKTTKGTKPKSRKTPAPTSTRKTAPHTNPKPPPARGRLPIATPHRPNRSHSTPGRTPPMQTYFPRRPDTDGHPPITTMNEFDGNIHRELRALERAFPLADLHAYQTTLFMFKPKNPPTSQEYRQNLTIIHDTT